MKKVVVLGAGMVGAAIAVDLEKKYAVRIVDKDKVKLDAMPDAGTLEKVMIDLTRPGNIAEVIEDADLVIGAVPGFLGFQTVKAVLEAGKNIVDISFFGEDAFELDELAKKNDLIAVVDCGVAPGLGNIIAGYHNAQMKIDNYECYVGGLPFTRTWPFQYKAPFSQIDVIEEYTRPSRMMRNGKVVELEALSEPELIEFDNVGTLEAFNTDGLRSLLKTMDIPNMSEKTMRYPGHREYMQMLKDAGFFITDKIDVDGVSVSPAAVTAKLLFRKWRLGREEREFTAMRIILEGEGKQIVYSLFDEYDEKTKTSSMARTTGYTCTATAELVLNGDFERKGISPPEFVGAEPGCFEKISLYLNERGITVTKKEKEITSP